MTLFASPTTDGTVERPMKLCALRGMFPKLLTLNNCEHDFVQIVGWRKQEMANVTITTARETLDEKARSRF